jgi:hypothetical protein
MEKKGENDRFQLVRKGRYRVLKEELQKQHYSGLLLGLMGLAMFCVTLPYQGVLASPSVKAWGAAGVALATSGFAIWALVKQIRGRLEDCDALDLGKETLSATFKRLEEEAAQQQQKDK